MICDISKHQGAIDWDKLAPELDFVVIKASGRYANGSDPYYARNVAGAVAHGVPFHAYHFLYCTTENQAGRDAQLFYDTVRAAGHMPLFWVLDCEGAWGVKDADAPKVVAAFVARLRSLAGDIRVAIYVARQKYYDYGLDYSRFAYVWIPGYGEKYRPTMPCDLWQYTSDGALPGVVGRVDLDVIIGDKPLAFFTGKTGMTDKQTEAKSMAVRIGSARIDENGKAHGGAAGDQTGKEVSTQSWYLHSKGWRVFRAKDPAVAEKIARCMQAACDNRHIGYDQYQRNTLYKEAEKFGFDVARISKDVETDCSALVRVCCAYAGVMGLPEGFRTANESSNLLKTGAFVELAGSKYQGQSTYLGRGDILVTRTQGHTVVVLSSGSRYEGSVEAREYALGERILRHGCEGADVKQMQEMLVGLGYDLGRYGVDGDFGDCTELALIAFQAAAGIEADGECGPITVAALDRALEKPEDAEAPGRIVRISGGQCYIRADPNTDGRKLGVAREGEEFPYGGETSEGGWPLIVYTPQGATTAVNAWVSGKYGKLAG